MTEYIHEYKQYPPPKAWVYTRSPEITSFYRDHSPPLSHQFSLHFLSCVWPHGKTSDCSPCLSRAVDAGCEATLRLIFLSSRGSCFPRLCGTVVPQELFHGLTPPGTTKWEVWSYLSLTTLWGLFPAFFIFSPCHTSPTSTLHLYSNLLAPWKCHVPSCLKAFAHAIPSAPKVLSYPSLTLPISFIS